MIYYIFINTIYYIFQFYHELTVIAFLITLFITISCLGAFIPFLPLHLFHLLQGVLAGVLSIAGQRVASFLKKGFN